MHQHATLEDTVYFWFASNDTGGSGDDGAAPLYDVRLGGAAAGAAPVLSGNGTLLTHANYPDGAHEIGIAATAANGFAAGNTYGVFCDLLVDGENPTGFAGSFTLGPIVSRLTPAGLQDVAQFMYRTTDQVSVLEAGVDNAKTAIEAANAGDVVILGPGTFALGNNFIIIPAGVSVIGAGMDTTIITSTSVGTALELSTGCSARDLTVVSSSRAVGGTSGGGAVFTDASLYRVKGVGTDDAFMVSRGAGISTLVARECIWESGYDGIVITAAAAGSRFCFIDNQIIVTRAGAASGVRNLSSATVFLWNTITDVISTASTAYGIYMAEAADVGSIVLCGGAVRTLAATTATDLVQAIGGALTAVGVEYDRSKVIGTVLEVSGLDAALGPTPTADSLMQRIQAIDVLTEAAGAGDLAAMLIAVLLLVPGAAIELTTEGENLITP